MLPLLVLFIGLPLLDLFVLVRLAGMVGIVPALLLVVATGIAGVALLKREGLSVLLRVQGATVAGEVNQAVVEGMLLAAGGLLLLSPGIITDALGFALVLPFTRMRAAARLRQRMQRSPNVVVRTEGI